MNKRRFIFNAFVLITILGLGACASKSINIVKTGVITVEKRGSNQVQIINVFVDQREDELYIQADVRPTGPVRFFHPGHLSFELLTSDGKRLFNFDVTRYTKKHYDYRKSAMKNASFWVRMPLKVPDGARLKVTHHNSNVHDNQVK